MKIDSLNWHPTCCAFGGDYAEAKTINGGVARIKRAPDATEYLVMRFCQNNKPIDVDSGGAPNYAQMSADEVEEILA